MLSIVKNNIQSKLWKIKKKIQKKYMYFTEERKNTQLVLFRFWFIKIVYILPYNNMKSNIFVKDLLSRYF